MTQYTPPPYLWLQWYDADEPGQPAHPEDQTWAQDQINDSDPCYVLVGDESGAAINRLERRIRLLERQIRGLGVRPTTADGGEWL
jgi:hypothetical protein